VDGITAMEAHFGVEMAVAAAQLSREQANKLVLRLLDRYEAIIETAPAGSTYQECYDITSGKPRPDDIRLYGELKEELAGRGIPFE